MVPLGAFTHYVSAPEPLAVNHQGQFPVVTISFNLAERASLGDAVAAVNAAKADLHVPPSIEAGFQGTAQAFTASLAGESLLILAAVVTVYIVLGVLYESYVHPITILSTLPSAAVGAFVALLGSGNDFSVIALIGIILLLGIVKKNAIMMIDFALEAERQEGRTPHDAIYQACLLRLRPILMTTAAALLGGVPLALGTGTGSELRRPLGITMIGGLIFCAAADAVHDAGDLPVLRPHRQAVRPGRQQRAGPRRRGRGRGADAGSGGGTRLKARSSKPRISKRQIRQPASSIFASKFEVSNFDLFP